MGLSVGLGSWFYATWAWLLVLCYLVILGCGVSVGISFGFYPTWAWLLVFHYLVRLGCGLRVGLGSWFYATSAWLLVLRYLVGLEGCSQAIFTLREMVFESTKKRCSSHH